MKHLSTLVLVIFSFSGFSQNELKIHCSSDFVPNKFYMNGIVVDGGVCVAEPAFHVVIITPNCDFWRTSYLNTNVNLNNNFGNQNNNGGCLPRPMAFFSYVQSIQNQLINLDSLINYWIPEDHYFAIYTPLGFNFENVQSLCPQLAQTLTNYWGNSIQEANLFVAFGKKDQENSFTLDTTVVSNQIEFTTMICYPFDPDANTEGQVSDDESNFNNSGLESISFNKDVLLFPNPIRSQLEIQNNSDFSIHSIRIINSLGQEVVAKEMLLLSNSSLKLDLESLTEGVYTLMLYSQNKDLISNQKMIVGK